MRLTDNIMDITERKKMELELKETENCLKGCETASRILWVSLKPDHTVIRYNKAGYETLGMSQKDVEGKKCDELIGRSVCCDVLPPRKP